MKSRIIEYRNGKRATWWRKWLWRAFPTMETYEVSQPWVIWTYFVPDWLTRVTGRTQIKAECCICGHREALTIRMPRWGPVVDTGPHPKRTAFLGQHRHPLQVKAPETWVMPLRNPAAHSDTLDILRDVAGKFSR